MTAPADAAPIASRELVLTRIIDAPREKLFRAWTDAELLKQWFAPLPYTTPVAELDVRPGGANLIVMRGPDGQDLPNRGVYLEVVENERLVVTDAGFASLMSGRFLITRHPPQYRVTAREFARLLKVSCYSRRAK